MTGGKTLFPERLNRAQGGREGSSLVLVEWAHEADLLRIIAVRCPIPDTREKREFDNLKPLARKTRGKDICKQNRQRAGQWWHVPFIPVLRRQSQKDR